MEVFCGRCGAVNRVDRVFCLRCRHRLFPPTNRDLTLADFVYPGDRVNLSVIEDAGWIPAAFASQRIRSEERALRARLSEVAVRPQTLGTLDMSMRRAGDQLGLEVLPEAFVVPSTALNAAVMGSERDSLFMITQVATQVLSESELGVVVGHELAHIKSRHMLYHTAAESISAGGSLIASFLGAGLIAYPLQMSLLSWYRESEITADRAALLMCGDMDAFVSMLTKTLLFNGGRPGPEGISGLFRTHPDHERRLALAREFYRSPEFSRGREKLLRRGSVGLQSHCRSCGSPAEPQANYCGACGRSLK